MRVEEVAVRSLIRSLFLVVLFFSSLCPSVKAQYYPAAAGPGALSPVLGKATAKLSTVATGTTLIPFDDTIPQNTEGDQYLTLNYTPISATSTIIITVNALVSASPASSVITAAVFRDAGVDSIGCSCQVDAAANQTHSIAFQVPITSGSIAATTFNLRLGGSSAGTLTVNGASGAQRYGGVAQTTMTLVEYGP